MVISPHRSSVPKFLDLEVIALTAKKDYFSKNYMGENQKLQISYMGNITMIVGRKLQIVMERDGVK